MSKKSKTKKNYPLEFPSKQQESESSPVIDDVVMSEMYGFNRHHHSNVFIDNITEVVTTETGVDTGEQTTHEQHT